MIEGTLVVLWDDGKRTTLPVTTDDITRCEGDWQTLYGERSAEVHAQRPDTEDRVFEVEDFWVELLDRDV